MKIKQEHREILEQAYRDLANEQDLSALHDRYRERGYSDMRYRWDIFCKMQVDGEHANGWACRHIYPYANDNNVDTVLKQLTGTK